MSAVTMTVPSAAARQDAAARMLFDTPDPGSEADAGHVPLRAALISLVALAIPIGAAIWDPDSHREYEALLWLLALVPAFLLAYHRGMEGVAEALALGMAALAIAHVTTIARGRPMDGGPLLTGIIAAYIATCFGVAWLSHRLQRDRRALEQLALTDALTGLANRRFGTLFLEKEFAAAQRGRRLALALIDIDHFKAYNDRHGHAAGDDVLRAVAGVLAQLNRATSLTVRLGGEEFLAILPDVDLQGALVYARLVQEQLAASPAARGVSVSIGVAPYDVSLPDPAALVDAADRALYEAKAAGRNCVRAAE